MLNLLRDVARRLGIHSIAQQHTESTEEKLQALIQAARRHFLAGKHDDALALLARASVLNAAQPDFTMHVLIEVSKAGVLARHNRAAEAAAILDQLETEIEREAHDGLAALVFIGKGVIDQEQGHLETAERYYESALKLARQGGADEIEGRAQGHLADIALSQNNASFASYLLGQALSKLRESSDFELHSYFMGRMGQALIAQGNYREGEQYLSRALRVAEHMGFLTFERMWRQSLAQRALERGKYNEARRHYVGLLARTEESSESYVELLCKTCRVCQRMGQYGAALDYARQAYELANTFNLGSQARLEAQMAMGINLRYLGENEQALHELTPPVEAFNRELFKPEQYSSIEMLRNLAAIYAELGNYDVALKTYTRALTAAEESDTTLDVAGTIRDQGILFARKGQPEDAINNWMTALQIYEQAGHVAQVARLYCDIANLRKQIGQPQRALEEYGKALILLSSIDDEETRGIVLANSAAAYVEQGDLESAESFFIESIKIAQKMGDRQAEATRRGNYGWFLLSTGRAERAIASLSYALRQSENLNLPLQVAVQTDNMGLAQMELGDFHEAVKFHRRAWETIQNIESNLWKATIASNLAHALLKIEAYDEAKSLVEQSLAFDVEDYRTELKAKQLTVAAEVNLASGSILTAEQQIDEVLSLAEHLQSQRLMAEVLRVRCGLYAKKNKVAEAHRDWERASELFSMLHLPLEPRIPRWLRWSQQENSR